KPGLVWQASPLVVRVRLADRLLCAEKIAFFHSLTRFFCCEDIQTEIIRNFSLKCTIYLKFF
ncbi:MAG: hypothetical protein FWG64_06875, partial [Firmicutes bacterium]|nr:hypothetical protein [Bacillota bacterium]